jgi:hypothetical protein
MTQPYKAIRPWTATEKQDALRLDEKAFLESYPYRNATGYRIMKSRLLRGEKSFIDRRKFNGRSREIIPNTLGSVIAAVSKVDSEVVHEVAEKEIASYEAISEIERLKSAHRKALKKLEDKERDRNELIEAVYQAAREAATTMHLAPVKPPKADNRKTDDETAILILSDWQLGKITPTYNSEVCADRIVKLADKVQRLVDIQRKAHPVKELRIYLLGDLIEGEDIFPGQAHLVDASLYNQVFHGGEILAGLVRKLSGDFERVRVVGVIGNHGRLGRKGTFHPESNADAMMYRIASMLVKEQANVEWVETLSKGERAWFATDEVKGKTWFLFHGDQVSGGFAGFPWYGFGKKLQGWNMTVARFDYSAAGHFHTPTRMYLNGITHWSGGSTESSNTYAQEQLAAAGEPCQWLLFQHESGVTAEYLVRLD